MDYPKPNSQPGQAAYESEADKNLIYQSIKHNLARKMQVEFMDTVSLVARQTLKDYGTQLAQLGDSHRRWGLAVSDDVLVQKIKDEVLAFAPEVSEAVADIIVNVASNG